MSRVRDASLVKVPLAAALALALAGCGQKGPLYLPEKGGTVVTTPAQTAPGQPEVSPAQPPQSAPAQPEVSPAPPPQSAPAPTPPTAPTPPKKTDKDSDSQTPQ
jgi:predicted small lipoprotein YifL